MKVSMLKVIFLGTSLWIACLNQAQAGSVSQVYGSTLTKQTQTAFIRAESGWTTYNSETANSNATVPTTAAAIGVFAGESRRLGLMFRHADYSIPFALNNSEARTKYYDLKMQARFGFFYPSISVSQMELSVKSPIDESDTTLQSVANMFGNAYGGGLGVYIPLTTQIVIHADFSRLKGTNVSDKDGKQVQITGRQDLEIAATADIIKNLLDLSVGYQQKRYDLEIDNVGYRETLSTPFAAMQLGLYF
jgi:hypothetical protein